MLDAILYFMLALLLVEKIKEEFMTDKKIKENFMSDPLLMLRDKPKAGEIYRHFKGPCYKIIAIAHHSETDEELVIYQKDEIGARICARPLLMFMSEVDRIKYPDVKQIYRFERV